MTSNALAAEEMKPSRKVTIETKSIAAGVGVTWGDGKLSFKGKDYPFSVEGLTLVDFGFSKASAVGEVYNLMEVDKFEGLYAGFALAGGMGGMVLRNQNGVGHAPAVGYARSPAPAGYQRDDHQAKAVKGRPPRPLLSLGLLSRQDAKHAKNILFSSNFAPFALDILDSVAVGWRTN